MTPSLAHTYVYGAASLLATSAGPALPLPTFPATLGLVPDGAIDQSFAVTASLTVAPQAGSVRKIVVSRSVSNVRFVSGQTRVLFISLLRACATASILHDESGLSACAGITAPTLPTFDPAHLPRVSPFDGGASIDATDEEMPPDVSNDAGAPDAKLDATPETRDAAVEMPPPLYPLGHACAAGTECQSNFCVDSVCCQSACTCGTCGGSTPGTCTPAAAGTGSTTPWGLRATRGRRLRRPAPKDSPPARARARVIRTATARARASSAPLGRSVASSAAVKRARPASLRRARRGRRRTMPVESWRHVRRPR